MKKVYASLFFFFTLLFVFGEQALADYIGPGLSFNDNLANIWMRQSGSTTQKLIISFRAPKTGNITGFRPFFQENPGYSNGTGGLIRARLWPSNGANPPLPNRTGTPLSIGQHQMPFVNGKAPTPTAKFPLFNLTVNTPVVAGALYFLELDNIDPTPQTNWTSEDGQNALVAHVTTVRHTPIEDWELIWEHVNSGQSTFHRISRVPGAGGLYAGLFYFPNAEFHYSDGTVFGKFRSENGNYNDYPYVVNSSTQIRERFNIKANAIITGMELHASAQTAGSLSITYKKNGVTVGAHTLTESPATYRTAGPNANGVYQWYSPDLATPFSVTPGDVLDIEMTAVGSAVWRMSADKSGYGDGVGLNIETTYGHSSAQIFTSGEWQNTLYYSKLQSGISFGFSHFRVILKTSSTASTPTPTPTPTPSFSPSPSSGPSACDQNHDTSINVLDLQSLANVILGKSTCVYACDLNQDGSVNVLDLQYLANVILGKNTCL